MGLDAGALNRRIVIERNAPVDDGYNTIPRWSKLAEVWAQFLPAQGGERFEAMGREARMPATWRIRWSAGLADLNPADRLYEISGGQRIGPVYALSNVIPMRRDGEIRIDAVATDDVPEPAAS